MMRILTLIPSPMLITASNKRRIGDNAVGTLPMMWSATMLSAVMSVVYLWTSKQHTAPGGISRQQNKEVNKK
jgi:hypothetical protein